MARANRASLDVRGGVSPTADAPPFRPKQVNMLGTWVHACSSSGLIDAMCRAAGQGRSMLVAYANAHAINLAYEDPALRAFFNRVADVVFCDGFGVKWGARLVGGWLPERMSPPDWIDRLSARCAREDQPMYLLGGAPGVADLAAARLRGMHPGLRIAGTHHGFFDTAPDSADCRAVLSEITASGASILLVGMGMPRQEFWLRDTRARLGPIVVMTVGALFDYLAGSLPRAPRWMTDHGMEWVGRLAVEPGRLWKRYLLGLPKLALRLLLQRVGWIRVDAG